jgi:hypothetical protein
MRSEQRLLVLHELRDRFARLELGHICVRRCLFVFNRIANQRRSRAR